MKHGCPLHVPYARREIQLRPLTLGPVSCHWFWLGGQMNNLQERRVKKMRKKGRRASAWAKIESLQCLSVPRLKWNSIKLAAWFLRFCARRQNHPENGPGAAQLKNFPDCRSVYLLCTSKVEVCGGNTVLLANKLVSKCSLSDIFAAIRPWRSSCPSALPLFICSSTSERLERHNVHNTSRKVNRGYSLNWVQSDQQAQTFQSCQSLPFLEAYTNCICKLPKIMSSHPL